MVEIGTARTQADFEAVLSLLAVMAEWDIAESAAFGIAAETIADYVYGDTLESLARDFGPDAGIMLLARQDGAPAGCIGWSVDADNIAEIHKFFVHPDRRGAGIGKRLIAMALADIDAAGASQTRLHTAVFMKDAVRLYQSLGFVPCPAFHDVPPDMAETDIFLARTRPA